MPLLSSGTNRLRSFFRGKLCRCWTAPSMPPEGLRRGAYVLADAGDRQPQVLLLATGSEVALCIEAYEMLMVEGIKARVVSMPSWEMFEHYCRNHPDYREQVLPKTVTARVSVEQGSTHGWERYVVSSGRSIGMVTFGASAPLSRSYRRSLASLPPTSLLEQKNRLRKRGKRCALP